MGAAMIALFVALRSPGRGVAVHVDRAQRDGAATVLAFLRVSKYPPSLDFALATLGPALIALALLERAPVSRGNALLVFGRVPMFFYLAHATLLPLLAAPLYRLQTGAWAKPVIDGAPEGAGVPLAGVNAIWALVVAALYWPCAAFGEYKRAHPEKAALRYL
jgi:hypothetical protein